MSPATIQSDFESIFAIEKARLQAGEPLSKESFRRAWNPRDLHSYSFNLHGLNSGRILREGVLWREIDGGRNTHRIWVALAVDSLPSQISSSQRSPFGSEPVAKPFKIPPPLPRWRDKDSKSAEGGSAEEVIVDNSRYDYLDRMNTSITVTDARTGAKFGGLDIRVKVSRVGDLIKFERYKQTVYIPAEYARIEINRR